MLSNIDKNHQKKIAGLRPTPSPYWAAHIFPTNMSAKNSQDRALSHKMIYFHRHLPGVGPPRTHNIHYDTHDTHTLGLSARFLWASTTAARHLAPSPDGGVPPQGKGSFFPLFSPPRFCEKIVNFNQQKTLLFTNSLAR